MKTNISLENAVLSFRPNLLLYLVDQQYSDDQ